MGSLSRRTFLLGGATLTAGATGLAGARLWPEQGVWNPCLGALPPQLAEHELVRAAWEGIDSGQVRDVHVHLLGTGDSGSGAGINPRMRQPWHVTEYARRVLFLNAGCVDEGGGEVDRRYVARLRDLVHGLRPGAKLLLYAFDRTHMEGGEADAEHSAVYVPNDYARDIARAYPMEFDWVASIHPYRSDAIDVLAQAILDGAKAIKWLPPAMGIDPASPRCDGFYAALARADLPLITHAGEERAVAGSARGEFGNPLRLRRALDAGVRVVVAHCASMGRDRDLDRGAEGPETECFALFARLMDERRYEGRLFGDLSALPQANRAAYLAPLIERADWHGRLLNGSDYPLPGLMPAYSMEVLVSLGLLDAVAAPVLSEIRRHNPLLFDFVLKRQLRWQGKAFPRDVFHTRKFFERARRNA